MEHPCCGYHDQKLTITMVARMTKNIIHDFVLGLATIFVVEAQRLRDRINRS